MVLDFLRRPRLGKRSAPPAVPPGARVYAVGDIHGEIGALARLVAMIRDDAAAAAIGRRVLVFLGDYVDRGLGSRQVIDFLLDDPAPGFETVFLKGNHDACLLAFLEDADAGLDWFGVGGQATLLSYGVPLPPGPRDAAWLERVRAAFARALPGRHKAFLERLSLFHLEGSYAFVHAGIRPGIPLEEQQEQDLLWIRDAFVHDRRNHGRVVVHGHSVTERPENLPNRIGIDTGAYATGHLTCLVLEGESRRFLAT